VIKGEWKNPALKRCDSKLAYRSLNLAAARAEQASNRTGELIIAYTCFDCGVFHIGHADLSQQLAHSVLLEPGCRQCGQTIPEAKKRQARAYSSKPIYCSTRCQKVAKKRRSAQRQMSIVTPPVGEGLEPPTAFD
jgi:hypothetical protein